MQCELIWAILSSYFIIKFFMSYPDPHVPNPDREDGSETRERDVEFAPRIPRGIVTADDVIAKYVTGPLDNELSLLAFVFGNAVRDAIEDLKKQTKRRSTAPKAMYVRERVSVPGRFGVAVDPFAIVKGWEKKKRKQAFTYPLLDRCFDRMFGEPHNVSARSSLVKREDDPDYVPMFTVNWNHPQNRLELARIERIPTNSSSAERKEIERALWSFSDRRNRDLLGAKYITWKQNFSYDTSAKPPYIEPEPYLDTGDADSRVHLIAARGLEVPSLADIIQIMHDKVERVNQQAEQATRNANATKSVMDEYSRRVMKTTAHKLKVRARMHRQFAV